MTVPARDFFNMTDQDLLPYARAGDREAFRAIMQRSNQRLFRVARAVVGTDEEAEDVLQEGYLRAFTGIASFRGESGLTTWLTSIILNEARGRLRRRRKNVELDVMDRQENQVIAFPGTVSASDPEKNAAQSETRRLLEAAINSLPPIYRLVFILRDVEECSIEETALQLDIKPETVKTRLFRARRLLRQHLDGTLAAALKGTFPFLGARCSRITDAVLAKMPYTES
jgi:RNA polymerase sigma-70 factor (ECF subfamily)